MFHQRLLKYSSMASGILGMQHLATAQSVYFDFDPDISLVSPPDSLLMDVNFDGIDDFQFFVNAGTYTGTYSSLPYTLYYATAGVQPMNGAGVLGTAGTYDIYVRALNCNDNFYSSSNFETQPSVFGSVLLFNVPGYGSYGPYSFGNFLNTSGKFMGFKYIENSTVKLGWMRISVNADASELILHDEEYNFNTQASIVCASVNENETAGFTFYADKNFLTLRFGNSVGESFSLYDLKGMELLNSELKSPEEKFDISRLPAGIYFIRILNGNEIQHAKFFKD